MNKMEEYKVITSGFYHFSEADEAAKELNNIFAKLGQGWRMTNFKVNTLENMRYNFYNPSDIDDKKKAIPVAVPQICYSAVAVKCTEESEKETISKSTMKDRINCPWEVFGMTEDEYKYRLSREI